MAGTSAGKIIGGVCLAAGSLISLVILLPIGKLSWHLWNGDAPDMIMAAGGGGWTFGAWQFLGVCAVILLVGVGLVGVGVQFLFRSPNRE